MTLTISWACGRRNVPQSNQPELLQHRRERGDHAIRATFLPGVVDTGRQRGGGVDFRGHHRWRQGSSHLLQWPDAGRRPIALADIRNPDTLTNVGSNEFVASGNTAQPAIGPAQTGGRGQILGSSLEASNVDMATQFTNLIVYQRGYEAATKVVSTADQMSQDLIGLIR